MPINRDVIHQDVNSCFEELRRLREEVSELRSEVRELRQEKESDALRQDGTVESSRVVMAQADRFVSALSKLGILACSGKHWDSFSSCLDTPPFWYFYPREDGGVGVYVEYCKVPGTKTYDSGVIESTLLEEAIVRVTSLGHEPARGEIWDALLGPV